MQGRERHCSSVHRTDRGGGGLRELSGSTPPKAPWVSACDMVVNACTSCTPHLSASQPDKPMTCYMIVCIDLFYLCGGAPTTSNSSRTSSHAAWAPQ
jgi:hypothetical protein